MTRRRCFNAGVLAWALLGAAARVQPQDRVRRIGYLGNVSPVAAEPRERVDAFRAAMRERGWSEGTDLRYEFCFADGNPNRFAGFMRELVALKVDLIAAMTTDAALAAQDATSTIPIVFIAAKPVEYGLVASLRRPERNLTGVVEVVDLLLNKRIQLFVQALPAIARLAFLTTNPPGAAGRTQAAANALGLELVVAQCRAADDLPRALESAAARADAWLVDDDALFDAHRARIVDAIAGQRKPAMYASPAWVRAGGLMAYAADEIDMLRRAADYADRILRGARPAELPVEEPTRFVLAMNLKTARQLGVALADSVLLQADEVID